MRSFTSRQACSAILIGTGVLAAAATALAAPSPPQRATITIRASVSFKPNQYLQLNDRYVPGTVDIASGGTITLNNTDSSEGHSLSLVKKSDVPRTANQVNNCNICNSIFQAHGINPNGPPPSGPPPHPVVNVGAPGFNTPGDSILVGPKGGGHSKVSFKVTAKRGTTLYFICIFHPWMQGKFVVR